MENSITSFDWFTSRAERECTFTKGKKWRLGRFSAPRVQTTHYCLLPDYDFTYDIAYTSVDTHQKVFVWKFGKVALKNRPTQHHKILSFNLVKCLLDVSTSLKSLLVIAITNPKHLFLSFSKIGARTACTARQLSEDVDNVFFYVGDRCPRFCNSLVLIFWGYWEIPWSLLLFFESV